MRTKRTKMISTTTTTTQTTKIKTVIATRRVKITTTLTIKYQ